MAEIVATITADTRLKYIAMMTMALEHERKVREIVLAINRMLALPDDGHVSDAIYGHYGAPLSIEEMDALLLREGIAVDG